MSGGYSTWITYSVTSVKDMRSDYDTFFLISFKLSESIMLHVFVSLYKQKVACDRERKAAWLGENWTCVMFQSLVYTCPVFFWRQIWSFDFLFLRAMVLNRDPKVKSPWFETRSGKNSATSQLLGSSARKFRRWSFTCVSEEANWAPFCNELCFLNPFSQLFDCRSIVVFFF